jgi:two-component system phosphate regulon sensor histidine kinase PhoR
MIRPGRYFPWKIGRKFFFSQVNFALIAIVIVGFSIRYHAYAVFLNEPDLQKALGEFDSYLTTLFFVVMAVIIGYQAWAAHFFFQPLGRLIQRARELRKTPWDALPAETDESALEDENPAEWHDLERTLNRIHDDLRLQTTALSREREELSALIGSVSDAILAVDKKEEALFYNSPFALFFKSKKASNLSEIFRVPEILEAYRVVLSEGSAQNINSSFHVFGHSALRHFSVSIAPLKSKTGEVYGAVGIFHDVTELKQAEQIRIEFVANASHELRTPLTSVKGYVETLKQDFQSGHLESAPKFLDVISRNVDRLIFLVNDLLDLSSIESGAELRRELIETREVTEAVFKALEARREVKKQTLSAIYKTEALMADPQRVEQVLINLVYNAIKYTPEGGKIEVIWENDLTTDETIVRVSDNGPGVPMEHQSRLFERFYRVDGGRTRDQGGTGLGLSIVKHIMLKHGGTIQIRSTSGQGSEFICRFPS